MGPIDLCTSRYTSRSTSRYSVLAAGLLVAALHHEAHAQEPQPPPRLPAITLYALPSANNNELRFGKELGFTGGATLQLRPSFSLTEQASMMHWRTQMHTYSVLVGPRFSPGNRRMTPYVATLAGIGHTGAASIPVPPAQSYGPALALSSGVDYRLSPAFSVRLVQGDLTHIFAGRGWTTQTGSTGFVLRVF